MKIKIAKLPGDGIGPEVVDQAEKAIKAVCKKFGHEVSFNFGYIGASAIDKFGTPYPEETHKICLESDAVLLGAVGDPKYDNDPTCQVRPEKGLLAIRKQLGLFANLRPVGTFSALIHKCPIKEEIVKGAHLLCVRELISGMYFGEKGRTDDGNTAFDTCVYRRDEIERIMKLSFGYAMGRKKHLTLVDKSNIMETSKLWRQIAQEMAPKYPEVKLDYMYVDNAAMKLINDPCFFDVIVTENTFGDILTDEASCISGSMGLLPSASIGEKTALFEPIHGSYPQAARLNKANPIAAILSAAMMFEYAFNLYAEGKCIRDAVSASLHSKIVTEDLAEDFQSYSTTEVGDWIANYIYNEK